MEFKSNINKLHYIISEDFKEVDISEKSSLEYGNYFEISIKENLECKVIIKKKDIESKTFNFLYSSNPLIENSNLIERTSSIELFSETIKDIIDNKRFDIDYINKK